MDVHRAKHRTQPFSHWVIEQAVSERLIAAINRDWPSNDDPRWRKEDGTRQKKWSMPAQDGAAARLVQLLSSASFCQSIADLIGEPEVHSDESQFGGGLHAIPPGGFLDTHCDFRFHPTGRKRVANLLLYVNAKWKSDWGGELVLGKSTQVEYLPIGGRAVIFRTDQNNWHGHPTPLACPDDVMRRSIAVYYYTHESGEPDKTKYRR